MWPHNLFIDETGVKNTVLVYHATVSKSSPYPPTLSAGKMKRLPAADKLSENGVKDTETTSINRLKEIQEQ